MILLIRQLFEIFTLYLCGGTTHGIPGTKKSNPGVQEGWEKVLYHLILPVS
jgi:hypothetical protein